MSMSMSSEQKQEQQQPQPQQAPGNEDPFTELEHKNWQRGVDAYTKGFGPLTAQAVPTLLDRAGFLVVPGDHGGGEPAAKGHENDDDDENDEKVFRLLDVACGPGQVVDAAIARAKERSTTTANKTTAATGYTALDFSSRFLALAETNLGSRHPGTTVEFVEGDAQDLPFPDGTFDAVACNFGILHLADPDSFLAESYRVLRPGGRLAFSVWAAPPATEAFAAVLDSVADSGNPNVELPDGPPFFRFADAAEARRSLEAAGFVGASSTVVESMEWTNLRATSADDLYGVFLEGTARTRELLRGQTDGETAAVRAGLQRRLDDRAATGRGHLRMPAVVSSGRKPAG